MLKDDAEIGVCAYVNFAAAILTLIANLVGYARIYNMPYPYSKGAVIFNFRQF